MPSAGSHDRYGTKRELHTKLHPNPALSTAISIAAEAMRPADNNGLVPKLSNPAGWAHDKEFASVNVVIINDNAHVNAGAAKVAIQEAVGLADRGHRIYFVCAVNRSHGN